MKNLSMKIRTFSLLCVFSIYPMISWGQSWKLSKTMTATLDKGIFTLKTTKESEAMPKMHKCPWKSVRDNIISVIVEEGIVTIGEGAFINCSRLTSIMLPNSLTTIDKYAFANCSSLTSICIPNSVEKIYTGAFVGCKNVTSITIPKSVTTIDIGAFWFSGNVQLSASMTSVKCDPNEPHSLKDIYVFRVIPYMHDTYIGLFCLMNKSEINLHVPSETEELFKADKNWKNFNIIGVERTKRQ